jgi:hypothetical protein
LFTGWTGRTSYAALSCDACARSACHSGLAFFACRTRNAGRASGADKALPRLGWGRGLCASPVALIEITLKGSQGIGPAIQFCPLFIKQTIPVSNLLIQVFILTAAN